MLEQHPHFPTSLGLWVSISECTVNHQNELLFHNQCWVPNSEPLCTKIIQEMHNFMMTGHSGCEVTYQLIAWQFFWPQMAMDVQWFCQNCDGCESTKVWQDQKHGLLKPLLVLNCTWSDISIDFVEKLPLSNGQQHIMVILDWLGNGVVLIGLRRLDAETVAWKFIKYYVPHYGFPCWIISNWESIWVEALWSTVCNLTQIECHLLTVWHSEMDSGMEWMNTVIESYLHQFTLYK